MATRRSEQLAKLDHVQAPVPRYRGMLLAKNTLFEPPRLLEMKNRRFVALDDLGDGLFQSESPGQIGQERRVGLAQHIAQVVATGIDQNIDRHVAVLLIDFGLIEADMNAVLAPIDPDNGTHLL